MPCRASLCCSPCDDDYLAVEGKLCAYRMEGGSVASQCVDDPPLPDGDWCLKQKRAGLCTLRFWMRQ